MLHLVLGDSEMRNCGLIHSVQLIQVNATSKDGKCKGICTIENILAYRNVNFWLALDLTPDVLCSVGGGEAFQEVRTECNCIILRKETWVYCPAPLVKLLTSYKPYVKGRN
ncbi:unnamed protein product [Ilex paraguariensis]|uniref:Uncharacterized protein n=1 Tax=Ilex paraguariensis TaxID=185542 RepID=A0ABC8UQ99_9AQUA